MYESFPNLLLSVTSCWQPTRGTYGKCETGSGSGFRNSLEDEFRNVLQFVPLSIQCDTGVKQHRDAVKPSLKFVSPGPPNRWRNTLFDPALLMQLECQPTLTHSSYPANTPSATEKFTMLETFRDLALTSG